MGIQFDIPLSGIQICSRDIPTRTTIDEIFIRKTGLFHLNPDIEEDLFPWLFLEQIYRGKEAIMIELTPVIW